MSRRNFTRSACITPISPRTAIVLPRMNERGHTSSIGLFFRRRVLVELRLYGGFKARRVEQRRTSTGRK